MVWKESRSQNGDSLCWLLASGFWLLASGFLASGFLASGFWLLASGFPATWLLLLRYAGAVSVCDVLMAQQRVPQLPEPTAPHPNPSRPIPKPEGATLKAPEGFNVSIYYDNLQGPRMMEWAPNGDLFVSQTGTSTIAVLRDTNNDGTPDTRSVFVQGPVPAPRGGGALVPAAGGGGRGGGHGSQVCTGWG